MTEEQTCLNCKTTLPKGAKFCYNCGQEARDLQIRFWELIGEFLSNTFNFDTRLGNTIIDLVKRPGEMTKQFHEGKRAKYVRPLQLYLFVSFVYFLLLSLTPATIVNQFPDSEKEAGLMVDKSFVKVNVDSSDIFLLGQNLRSTDPNDDVAIDSLLSLTGETEHSDLKRHLMKQTVRAVNPKYAEVLKDEVFANLSLAMFLLLPVFASLLWLIVRKISPYYIDSLIFSIHFHTVVFIIFSVGALTDLVISSDIVYQILVLLVAMYLLLSLKRVYGLNWKKAISRTIGLGFSYAFIFGISYLVILGISFWLY